MGSEFTHTFLLQGFKVIGVESKHRESVDLEFNDTLLPQWLEVIGVESKY